ncbi:PREDICTED: uncharacterized protein LOC108561166 [Nicrophorus vespilloides]|uniref:Uncharacterized protein LOC108561166 n=1 Tax=Nicrophorus vespilloides TaxID=110193 RepID=A0ABM1MIS3_NICVS|nr:PREDICTED: uncharacterized protein LOC108561166 [Nicrophorus vespilloides]
MKCVALLVCILAICLADFETDLNFIKICNQTSPISLRTMNEVLIYKKLSKSKSSNNFKCFLHCLFTQYGWMDEEGGFELHEMRALLEESGTIQAPVLEYIMYTCTAIKSVDRCERAFLFTECFWAKTSEDNGEEDQFFYSLDENPKK